jgi:hypothetical protein
VDLVRKGPKGVMKSHSSSAWMVGPVKEMTGSHRDGGPLTITMQVRLTDRCDGAVQTTLAL